MSGFHKETQLKMHVPPPGEKLTLRAGLDKNGAYRLVVSSQEILDEVVLVGKIVWRFIKVSQNMTLLLPEVDQLLEFHLALGIEDVCDVQVVHKSLSLKFLSDLGLDARNGHIQLVQVAELLGVSDILAVQVKNSSSHVRLTE